MRYHIVIRVSITSVILIGILFLSCNIGSTYPQLSDFKIGNVNEKETDGYTWFSYIPSTISRQNKNYIFLNVGHRQLENYDDLVNDAQDTCRGYIDVAEDHGIIIVEPAIPRNFDIGYYPQGINYYSLQEDTPDFYRRPDKKVNKMLDQLISSLKKAEYNVEYKVLVSGFSAGGMWANRYTVLHPERVLAAAIGQAGGWVTVSL